MCRLSDTVSSIRCYIGRVWCRSRRFGVVSLAIQIADNLRKAADFWDSVKNGPNDINRLSTELQGLANILTLLEYEYKSTKDRIPEWQEQLIIRSLMSVKKEIDQLANLISDLDLNIGGLSNRRQRCWARVNIAWKGAKLTKLRGYIRNSMDILHLLLTSQNQYGSLRASIVILLTNAFKLCNDPIDW